MKRKNFDDFVGKKLDSGNCIGVIKKDGRSYLHVICSYCNNTFHLKPCHVDVIKSCGCNFNRHGFSKHPLYNICGAIISRCTNPKDIGYHRYGGRGIFICQEWLNDRVSFVKWALNNKWENGLQIDRIDNNDGYYPENCRIVTRKENLRNTRLNSYAIVNGKKMLLMDLAKDSGVSIDNLRYRIKSGWNMDDALNTEKDCRRRHHTYFNGEKVSINELSEKFGIKKSVLRRRIFVDNLSAEDAVYYTKTPIKDRAIKRKLDIQSVVEIKKKIDLGVRPNTISLEFNVSRSCIRSIKDGNSWKWV